MPGARIVSRAGVVTRVRAAFVAVVLLCGVLLSSTPTQASAVSLPGNRANYVFSFVGVATNATFLRMGTFVLHTDGTVDQRQWFWNQAWAPATRDVTKFRTNTGYTTGGCGTTACQVWTARSFKETVGTSRPGTWKYVSTTSGTRIQMIFGGFYELYDVINTPTYSELRLVSSNYPGYSSFHGRAVGSTWSLSQGVSLDQMRAATNGLDYTEVVANWGTAGAKTTVAKQWWNSTNYTSCSTTCMRGINPGYWHSAIVADPGTQGRKMFWYHELASVAGSTVCPNPAKGGHTLQLLQAIDDNGAFVGLLGGEASIMAQYSGGSIVSYYGGTKI